MKTANDQIKNHTAFPDQKVGGEKPRRDVKKLKPIGDRVMVLQDAAADMTKEGIIIPDNVKKKPLMGMVIAMGPGLIIGPNEYKTMVVKVGDHVMFGAFAGTRVEVNEGEEYLLMREADIFLVDENVVDDTTKS